MTNCDILMYLFAAFFVAGCGLVFVVATINEKKIKLLKEEIKCEERRFNQLWDQFAALDKANQELVEVLTAIAEYWNQDTNQQAMEDACWYTVNTAQAALAKHREQA